MYRYEQLKEIRKKIKKINNAIIVGYGAFDNSCGYKDNELLNNYTEDIFETLKDVTKEIQRLECEMIIDTDFSSLKIKLSELNTLLYLLKKALESDDENIDDSMIDDIFNILVRVSDSALLYAGKSRCKTFPDEGINTEKILEAIEKANPQPDKIIYSEHLFRNNEE